MFRVVYQILAQVFSSDNSSIPAFIYKKLEKNKIDGHTFCQEFPPNDVTF